jgi:anti-sigma B factor antagonist
MTNQDEDSLDEPQFASGQGDLDGSVLIELSGELDISNAEESRELFARSEVLDAPVVYVDLSEATFIDSITIGVLVSACKRVRASDGTFSVRCDVGAVRSTLEFAGLVDFFELQSAFQRSSEREEDQTRSGRSDPTDGLGTPSL